MFRSLVLHDFQAGGSAGIHRLGCLSPRQWCSEPLKTQRGPGLVLVLILIRVQVLVQILFLVQVEVLVQVLVPILPLSLSYHFQNVMEIKTFLKLNSKQ